MLRIVLVKKDLQEQHSMPSSLSVSYSKESFTPSVALLALPSSMLCECDGAVVRYSLIEHVPSAHTLQ